MWLQISTIKEVITWFYVYLLNAAATIDAVVEHVAWKCVVEGCYLANFEVVDGVTLVRLISVMLVMHLLKRYFMTVTGEVLCH